MDEARRGEEEEEEGKGRDDGWQTADGSSVCLGCVDVRSLAGASWCYIVGSIVSRAEMWW